MNQEYMTAIVKTTKRRVTVLEEKPRYSFNELMADVGGASGLILGLSVVKIVEIVFKLTSR